MVPEINPVKAVQAAPAVPAGKKARPASAASFAETLQQVKRRRNAITISAHARERMATRKIELREEDLQRINEAMDRAGARGARSSLLLYGEVALLASITNRTIITAVDGAEEQEQIFTGIDSAVIIK